ncbi:MAG: hypothetical protein ACHQZQ_09635, partial [SAR324 cluster bacterium]
MAPLIAARRALGRGTNRTAEPAERLGEAQTAQPRGTGRTASVLMVCDMAATASADFPFPGQVAIDDGTGAVVWVET